MSRPAALFPLFAALDTLPGVGPRAVEAYGRMGITLPRDLLLLLPVAGVDRTLRASLRDYPAPGVATVTVTVGTHQPAKARGKPARVNVRDAALDWQVVFFHAHPESIAKDLPTGQRRILSGKFEIFDGVAQMVHPDHILREGSRLPAFEPVYPLSAGITQKAMRRTIEAALTRAPELAEWIDAPLLAEKGWPSWREALVQAHNPTGEGELAPTQPARARLAYDELFAHQITLALARQRAQRGKGRASVATGALSAKVRAALPYPLTGAQERAVREITADLAAPERMNRLLQGDVGAGKTLVALLALLAVVEAGGQGVLMAPTEILARQHAESLAPLAEAAGVRLLLLTGRDKGAERAAKLAALAEGRADILIGTHAVFQRDVAFADLRLAVIDEQHRFGVAQRMELGAKGEAADVLVMTATPIPRSLALASYGDMDVSVLDEKPPGRKPVTTVLASDERLGEIVTRLRVALAEGRQAYWVCPLVAESETSALPAAEERFAALRAQFPDQVGLVHGQMPPAEKDAAMAAFAEGRLKLLVATTVIEVGVNVPNASIMVIEGAETYGLAQLHQLRGRVGRGAAESTCVLLYSAPLAESARRRLTLLRETEDGFRIAEEDLAMRGAGDLIGTAQSGLPRFRVADLERQAGLMELAQSDARALLARDPELTSPRGKAARMLLWLLEQDKAARLLTVG